MTRNGTDRIGEVIETRTTGFWSECDDLNDAPPLGAFVRTSNRLGQVIYGVVSLVQTTGLDPSRRAIRRGSAEVQDEDVYRNHPELAQILRTTFEASPVGYDDHGRFRSVLPSVVAPLHYSVRLLENEELRRISDDPAYLSRICEHHGDVAPEQILIHHVRHVYAERGNDLQWLNRAAEQITRAYRTRYDDLLPVLAAIDPDQ